MSDTTSIDDLPTASGQNANTQNQNIVIQKTEPGAMSYSPNVPDLASLYQPQQPQQPQQSQQSQQPLQTSTGSNAGELIKEQLGNNGNNNNKEEEPINYEDTRIN